MDGGIFYGVSQAEIMTWCSVDRSTAQRWKRGISRPPGAAVALLRLRVYGEADALLGPDWRGWTFGRDGLLYAPGWRRGFTPGEILSFPYLHGQIDALRHALDEQKEEVKILTSRLAAAIDRDQWYNRRARLA